MRKVIAVLALAAVMIAAVIAPTAGAAKQGNKDIVAVAVGAGQFKTLASLLTSAGLVTTLQSKGPFTVFVPTDAAFAKVPKATLAKLGKDKALLKSVLLYHVVKGNVPAGKVVTLKKAGTVNGKPVSITIKGGKVYLNGATLVTKTDIKASNGTIHVINKVLLPPAN